MARFTAILQRTLVAAILVFVTSSNSEAAGNATMVQACKLNYATTYEYIFYSTYEYIFNLLYSRGAGRLNLHLFCNQILNAFLIS